jgi:hypothetical protein
MDPLLVRRRHITTRWLGDHQQNKRLAPSCSCSYYSRTIDLHTLVLLHQPGRRSTLAISTVALPYRPQRTRRQPPRPVYLFLSDLGTPLCESLSLPGWRQIWIPSRKPTLRPIAALFFVTKWKAFVITITNMRATSIAITTISTMKTFQFLQTPNMPSRPLLPSWPSTFRHSTIPSAI